MNGEDPGQGHGPPLEGPSYDFDAYNDVVRLPLPIKAETRLPAKRQGEKLEIRKRKPILTESEQRLLLSTRERIQEASRNGAMVSRTSRIDAYNERLSKLSDHFSMPKIGPG